MSCLGGRVNNEGYGLFDIRLYWNQAVIYEPMAFISSQTRALAHEKRGGDGRKQAEARVPHSNLIRYIAVIINFFPPQIV